MIHALFIRSYDGDSAWLRFALMKLRTHADLDNIPAIVVTDPWAKEIPQIAKAHGIHCTASWLIGSAPTGTSGYLVQQIDKLAADLYLPEADLITYWDSDIFLHDRWEFEFLMQGDRPELLHTPWDEIPDAKAAWKGPTESAMRRSVPFEFMRRLPAMYPASVVFQAREWLETTHARPMAHVVANSGRFSEFNYLGAWAWFHAREAFHWTLATEGGPTIAPLPLVQNWSKGDLPAAVNATNRREQEAQA